MVASSKIDILLWRGFTGFDAISEIETQSIVDNEKSICGVDIVAKATNLVEPNIETMFASDSLVVAVNLEEEIRYGLEQKPPAVVLQLALEKQQNV
ncbi:hypothetical protein V6N13_142295 [Hibiscus sabdariffa]